VKSEGHDAIIFGVWETDLAAGFSTVTVRSDPWVGLGGGTRWVGAVAELAGGTSSLVSGTKI
jgi:hypothetical protein